MKENSGKKVLKVKVSQNDSPYPSTPKNFHVDSEVKVGIGFGKFKFILLSLFKVIFVEWKPLPFKLSL